MTQSHAIANFQPSTGIGLFDAAYDAARQELAVNVRCAFRFTSGKRQDFPAAEALKKATGVEEWIFAE